VPERWKKRGGKFDLCYMQKHFIFVSWHDLCLELHQRVQIEGRLAANFGAVGAFWGDFTLKFAACLLEVGVPPRGHYLHRLRENVALYVQLYGAAVVNFKRAPLSLKPTPNQRIIIHHLSIPSYSP